MQIYRILKFFKFSSKQFTSRWLSTVYDLKEERREANAQEERISPETISMEQGVVLRSSSRFIGWRTIAIRGLREHFTVPVKFK